jgi:hypothetical protein
MLEAILLIGPVWTLICVLMGYYVGAKAGQGRPLDAFKIQSLGINLPPKDPENRDGKPKDEAKRHKL